MSVGRGAPEIDALEAQKNKQGAGGRVSQSAQFAPFSYNYTFDMSAITVVNTSATIFNPYRLVSIVFSSFDLGADGWVIGVLLSNKPSRP